MNKQQCVSSPNYLVKHNILGMKDITDQQQDVWSQQKYKKLLSETNEPIQPTSAASPAKRHSGSLFSHHSTSLTKNGQTKHSETQCPTNKQEQNDPPNLSPMQRTTIRQRTNPKISVLKTIVTSNKIEINPLFSNNIIFSNLHKSKREQTIPKKRSLNLMKPEPNKQLPRIQTGEYQETGSHKQVCQLAIEQRSSGAVLGRQPSESSKRSQFKISLSRNKSNSSCNTKLMRNKKVAISPAGKRPKLQVRKEYNCRTKQGNSWKGLQIKNIIDTDLKFLQGQNAYHFQDFVAKIQSEEICRKVINISKWMNFRYSNIDQK